VPNLCQINGLRAPAKGSTFGMAVASSRDMTMLIAENIKTSSVQIHRIKEQTT